MMRIPLFRGPFVIALLLLVAAACTPAAPRGAEPGPNAQASPAAAASGPKRLVIGVVEEPKGWAPWIDITTAGGAHQTRFLLLRTMTIIDGSDQVHPVLAASVPTLDNGDWRINPDGTMEQTWKLKPNAKWHDGSPLTAEDFVFGYEVETSPLLPSASTLAKQYIAGVTAPDPQTVVVQFKGTTPVGASFLYNPYPRHLLADRLAADPDQFPNLDYWTTGQIAAGPYALASWQPGSFQEFTAFADYIEGKPKIDRITLRFLQDPNTLVANILSGELDVVLPEGLSLETATELKRTWAGPGSGNQVIMYPDGRLYRMEFQGRPEYAKPAAARDPRVREAFYYTIDKEGLNDGGMAGAALVADSWVLPDDARRPQFANSIPAWAYDISRAQRVLEEAGWRRGSDGILVNDGTGERMDVEIRVTGSKGHANMLAIMANDWRKVGATVTETVIPAAQLSVAEYRATFPFTSHTGHPLNVLWENSHFSCARAARAETRWVGNRNGYCNAASEPLIQQLQVTIPERDRTPLQAEIMRIVLKDDFGQLPLYWSVTPYTVAKGVTGPGPMRAAINGGSEPPWNIHTWDKQ
jgi:ABC-type transport system substrate-binding protein